LSWERLAESLEVEGWALMKGLGYCDIYKIEILNNYKSDRSDQIDFLFDQLVILVDHVLVVVDNCKIILK
jgi:hypothetical protein